MKYGKEEKNSIKAQIEKYNKMEQKKPRYRVKAQFMQNKGVER